MQASADRSGRYGILASIGLAQDEQAGTAMRELLAELVRALDEGRPCVYCSVVETRGSTPQKAGAAMLVFPDGGQVGTLGGGCVEAEVKRKALRTLAGDGDAAARGAHLLPRRQLRLGRRPDLRRPHEHPRRPADRSRRTGRAPTIGRFAQLVEAGARLHRGGRRRAEPPACRVGSRYLFDADGELVDQLGDGRLPATIARST